jgi:hypothetical protein
MRLERGSARGGNKAYLDAALCLRFEVHVNGHIREDKACDAVPGPRLNPPRRYDEEYGPFHTPASPRIRHYYHCHIDREARRLQL